MAKLFHYLIFSTIVAVAFIRRCETAKSKKFKFPDEKKVVQYNGKFFEILLNLYEILLK